MLIEGRPAKKLLEFVDRKELSESADKKDAGKASKFQKLAAKNLARCTHPNTCLNEEQADELRSLIDQVALLYEQDSEEATKEADSLMGKWCVKAEGFRIKCAECLSANYCSAKKNKSNIICQKIRATIALIKKLLEEA